MKVTTIGMDIAKRIFQIHGVDKNGKTILKKKLTEILDEGDLSQLSYRTFSELKEEFLENDKK